MTSRLDRRRMRRSSPDAPQGAVPVLVVFAGLLAIIGVSVAGSDTGAKKTSVVHPMSTAVAGHQTQGDPKNLGVPKTSIVYRAGSTSLFTTTTTPITTTSSTTTTLPSGPSFLVLQQSVSVDAAKGFGVLTVYSRWTRPVGFFVTGTPPGMVAVPDHGITKVNSPAQIRLTVSDPDGVRSGSVSLIGANGTRVSIPVLVADDLPQLSAVTTDPTQPICGLPTDLVAAVSGQNIVRVTVLLTGASPYPTDMTSIGNGRWSVLIPGSAVATMLSGTVVVTDARGRSASRSFSITVVDTGSCGP